MLSPILAAMAATSIHACEYRSQFDFERQANPTLSEGRSVMRRRRVRSEDIGSGLTRVVLDPAAVR
jgi:hypothetical protein